MRSGMIFEFGFPFLAHFCPKPNPSYNQSKMGMRPSVEFQSPSRDANSTFGPRPSRPGTKIQFSVPVPLVPGRKLNLGYFPIFFIQLFYESIIRCDLTVRTLKTRLHICVTFEYESLLLTIGHVTSMTMTH